MDNPKFLSNIESFIWDCSIVGSTNCLYFNLFQPFLTSLPSSLSLIKYLDVDVDQEILTAKNLADLIQSQTQLLSLSLRQIRRNSDLFDAFKHCSDSLISIKFFQCDFSDILTFDGLKYLTQLESLQFYHCYGLTIQAFQPLLGITVPLKIKSLRVFSLTSGIDLLIQKVGSYLENLELDLTDTERKNAFKSIVNYCDKIKFLYLYRIDDKDLPQLCKLITHLNKHLKYLYLENKHLGGRGNLNSSAILRDLGQTLPDSLEYLELNLEIDPNDLKHFLDNCKHIVGLDKLLVRNSNTKNLDITFNALKEFVMENNVNYLAYLVECIPDSSNSEHQNLRKLVKEIQPFVKMKRYIDLICRNSRFWCGWTKYTTDLLYNGSSVLRCDDICYYI